MKLKVCGVEIPLSPGQTIDVEMVIDDNGERMPKVDITATGGRLDCYLSDVTKTGNINTHIWGDAKL